MTCGRKILRRLRVLDPPGYRSLSALLVEATFSPRERDLLPEMFTVTVCEVFRGVARAIAINRESGSQEKAEDITSPSSKGHINVHIYRGDIDIWIQCLGGSLIVLQDNLMELFPGKNSNTHKPDPQRMRYIVCQYCEVAELAVIFGSTEFEQFFSDSEVGRSVQMLLLNNGVLCTYDSLLQPPKCSKFFSAVMGNADNQNVPKLGDRTSFVIFGSSDRLYSLKREAIQKTMYKISLL